MDDMIEILTSTATRLFEQKAGDDAARAARAGALQENVWQAVEEAGLPLALLPEEHGGFGLHPADALNLIRICGAFGSPVPLGETMIANWLGALAGFEPVEGVATFAELSPGARLVASSNGWFLTGTASWVPWARHARRILLLCGEQMIVIEKGQAAISQDMAGNGLARDDVAVDAAIAVEHVRPRPTTLGRETIEAAGALIRALEMAGVLRSIVTMTVGYAGERIQFGKPIAKLQAIQQQLAVLADEAAAANAAVDFAIHAWDDVVPVAAVAVAKARAGEAAGIAAAIAHQVLGAIGFTEEHRLHLFTKALWAWRDEYGSERLWQRRLGERALAAGREGFWPFVTGQAQGEAA